MYQNLEKSTRYIAVIIFLNSYAVAHEGHHHGVHSSVEKAQSADNKEKENLKIISKKYDQNVRPIFDQKCLSCHGGSSELPWYSHLPIAGSLMRHDREESVTHVDMSKGFPFAGHGTNEEDLDAILKSSNDGSMPPRSFKLLHWQSSLNENEKNQIQNWVIESKNLLKNSKANNKD